MRKEEVRCVCRPLFWGKSLTGCLAVPGHPVDEGTCKAPMPMYIRLTDGQYIPHILPTPQFIFTNSASYLNSPSHFFISVLLSFPNRKSVRTYALVDSGATTSCISERFAN